MENKKLVALVLISAIALSVLSYYSVNKHVFKGFCPVCGVTDEIAGIEKTIEIPVSLINEQ